MTDLFGFLKAEWSEIHEAAAQAAGAAHPDPRTACFYARRTLELAVNCAFKFDRSLHLPYQENLSALIHEPTFKAAAGPVFHKARLIKDLGNDAAHRTRRITPQDGVGAVREAKDEKLSVLLADKTALDEGVQRVPHRQSPERDPNRVHQFINLIVNHLTEQGTMSADLLYESPFTDVTPTGPEGLFTPAQLDVLTAVLRNVEAAAVGS